MKNWLKIRYNLIRSTLSNQPFNLEQVSDLLAPKFKDKNEKLLVMLSELKKLGLVETELDPKDSRKRIYRLKEPENNRITRPEMKT